MEVTNIKLSGKKIDYASSPGPPFAPHVTAGLIRKEPKITYQPRRPLQDIPSVNYQGEPHGPHVKKHLLG